MDSPTLSCRIPADWFADFSQCLFDWQALAGGVLALLAAGLSILFLHRQITQSENQHREEIARRHRAARISMPLTLTNISELTQRVADMAAEKFEFAFEAEIDVAIDEYIDGMVIQNHFHRVDISPEIISNIQNFVETLNNEDDVKHLAELMASLQIMIARFNSFELKQGAVNIGLIDIILDAAKVYLLNQQIYNYARFVDEKPFGILKNYSHAQAWDQIHGCAESLVFLRKRPEVFFEPFNEAIKFNKGNQVSPWNEVFR